MEVNDQSESELAQVANEIINSATCIDRGEDKGRCHVFLDHSDICQCGQVDLAKERMK